MRGFLPGPGAAGCFLPDYVTGAAERSLRRLRTGHVDVLLLHGPPLATIEEGAFVPGARAAGGAGEGAELRPLVRHRRGGDRGPAAAGPLVAAAAYSLLARSAVEEILPEARERGVGVVAAQPFADGSLFALAERELPEAGDLVSAAALRFAAGAGLASVLVGMSRPENVARNMRAASEPHPQERLAAIGARLGAAATAAGAGGEGRA